MERLSIDLYTIQPLNATNLFGESLEIYPDGIVLNLDYWDCECAKQYIHPTSQEICPHCGAEQEEMPCSREREVIAWRETGCPTGQKLFLTRIALPSEPEDFE
ncbi:hypothetical protein [Armatimonas sp.]|uniref:hypothetical protein n=1 Tax=Armatimonas sp. TaxID=1872638 RepID=UPI00375370E3